MKWLCAFAFIVVAVSAVLDDEFKQKVMSKVQAIGAECAEQENANGDDIGELLAKKPPSRKEGKCLLACFNQKFGGQDKDGKMDLEGALKSVEPFKAADAEIYEKIKKIIDTCIPEVGDTGDRCENALKMSICSKRVSEELGITEEILM